MTERWHTDPLYGHMSSERHALEQVMYKAPAFFAVEDTGVADALYTLRHDLGRVPRGMRIINAVASDAPGWYRLATDPDWTKTELSFRCTVASARLMLEVF